MLTSFGAGSWAAQSWGGIIKPASTNREACIHTNSHFPSKPGSAGCFLNFFHPHQDRAKFFINPFRTIQPHLCWTSFCLIPFISMYNQCYLYVSHVQTIRVSAPTFTRWLPFHAATALHHLLKNVVILQGTMTAAITRMWANAQRDGRPAEYKWRPLCNAARFACRPLLHGESKKGATLAMTITWSILDRFTKFFHCCKEH